MPVISPYHHTPFATTISCPTFRTRVVADERLAAVADAAGYLVQVTLYQLLLTVCITGQFVAVGGRPAGARVPGGRAAGTCWTAASWPLAGAGAERGSGQVVGQHDLVECHRRFPGQPLGVAGVVALREMGEHEQPRPAPQCAKSEPGCASCRHRSTGR